MLLPQTTEYAIRAAVHLAASDDGSYAGVAEIADATAVPPQYLAKVLGQLARAGVLHSSRGPAGGFRLARAASDTTLAHIADVFRPGATRRCLLGHGVCGSTPDCAVHALWSPVATQLQEFLNTTTVADLSRGKSLMRGGVQ
jgi:Rrf2 family protein